MKTKIMNTIKHGDVVKVTTSSCHMIENMNPTCATNEFVAVYNAKDNVYHPLKEDSYFAIGMSITDVVTVSTIDRKKKWILGNGKPIESL